MNPSKIIINITHAAIIASMAYFSTHPDSSYLWLSPGIVWLAQCMDPPSITVSKPNV
jgi:hypothetical protein